MLIKNWIIYIAAVVGLSVFCILYIKQSGFVLLLMTAAVPPLFSLAVFFPAKRGVRVLFDQELLSAAKFEPIEIPVVVENRSDLNQGSRAVVYISVKSGVGADIKRIKRKINLVSRREEIVLQFVPKHSGMNEIKIEKIRIYNGISLLRPTVRVNAGTSFLVMPEYREFPIEPDTIYEENEGESDRFSSSKPGNDPSELYDIRHYRPGDKLNRINWKFSAKHDTLMVQDYGFSIACDTAVFVDISEERDLDKIERVFEILYFLAVKFTISEKMFYVIWKDFREGSVKRKMISGKEAIYDLFMEIFRSDMGRCQDHIEDLYNIQYEGEFLSGCIFIYTGRKQVEDEIVRTKLRTDYLEFVYV